MSGSSASPMRSVVWAWAPARSDSNSAAANAAKRKIFIGLVSIFRFTGLPAARPRLISTPDGRGYFRRLR